MLITDLSRRDQGDAMKVLALVAENGVFSTFAASANSTIARTMTGLFHSRPPLLESYTPESYKSKPEPGGARAPDRDTYPYTYVKLTDAGRASLEHWRSAFKRDVNR